MEANHGPASEPEAPAIPDTMNLRFVESRRLLDHLLMFYKFTCMMFLFFSEKLKTFLFLLICSASARFFGSFFCANFPPFFFIEFCLR